MCVHVSLCVPVCVFVCAMNWQEFGILLCIKIQYNVIYFNTVSKSKYCSTQRIKNTYNIKKLVE